MQRYRSTKHMLRALLLLFSFGLVAEVALTSVAEARAGRGRSFGQKSAPSYSRPAPQQNPNYSQPPSQGSKGSFMKGLAGGLAGGFLGSMLFSSLGHAAGVGGAGSGGIGFLEIILLAGAGFLLYRLWKSRSQARYQPAFSGGAPAPSSQGSLWTGSTPARQPGQAGYFASGLGNTVAPLSIDRETAEDLFFRIQAAWMRRDLTLVRDILNDESSRYLESDIQSLKAQGHINRLENISVRQFTVVDTWQEADLSYSKVRFTANLLDYTTDESGQILEGSNSVPVKFDEYWIFVYQPSLARWQLAGMEAI